MGRRPSAGEVCPSRTGHTFKSIATEEFHSSEESNSAKRGSCEMSSHSKAKPQKRHPAEEDYSFERVNLFFLSVNRL